MNPYIHHSSFIEERWFVAKNNLCAFVSLIVQQSPFNERAETFKPYHFWATNPLLLSYRFTKKRLLKIFKIEKINRQAVDKSTPI